MKSVERSPKQKVAKWARDVLGEEAYTSPRCPRYPECGGEDGSGALMHGEGRVESSGLGVLWSESIRTKMRKRREAAPRCRECAKYAKAVESLLAKLEAGSG